MKIVTVVGARPQFIKAAVVSRVIARTAGVEERLVHTGQHYDRDMSQIFFEELEIPEPHHQLRTGSGSHAEQTARMLIDIESLLLHELPDCVLVYGDTNTTLAAALAASKLGVDVVHVEAGLRSFDRSMPEEINRVLTDHLSQSLFCPTVTAVTNLAREGIENNVHRVGDVMHDALRYYGQNPQPSRTLKTLGLENAPYALCTIHRAGNVDDEGRFGRVWEGLNRLSEILPVVLPIHPRARHALEARGFPITPHLHVTTPVGYREMLELERRARLVVTDSGGVQKEAYLHGIPCITLRDNTEWTETVEAGWNRLVGIDADALLDAAHRFLEAGPPTEQPAFYGEGDAGERIVSQLIETRTVRSSNSSVHQNHESSQTVHHSLRGALRETA